MKKHLIAGITGSVAILTLLTGCVTEPNALENPNAPAKSEPLSYFGSIDAFEERSVPLAVAVTVQPSSDSLPLADTLTNTLNKSDVQCVAAGQPFDVQIAVNSAYSELTPAPQCRLFHRLTISVADTAGTMLLPIWEHKTDTIQAYSSLTEAQTALRGQINESIRLWEQSKFRNEAGRCLKASVLRYRMSRPLIDLNPIRFEKDQRYVLNRLRQIPGVVTVRIIEADRNTRIASFRIVYRNDLMLKDYFRK